MAGKCDAEILLLFYINKLDNFGNKGQLTIPTQNLGYKKLDQFPVPYTCYITFPNRIYTEILCLSAMRRI